MKLALLIVVYFVASEFLLSQFESVHIPEHPEINGPVIMAPYPVRALVSGAVFVPGALFATVGVAAFVLTPVWLPLLCLYVYDVRSALD